MLLWPWTVAGFGSMGFATTVYHSLSILELKVLFCIIAYRPINTVFSTNLTYNTVTLNDPFALSCNADANPPARYRLFREHESLEEQSNGTFVTFASTRTKQVTFRCIPFNSFGDGHSKTISVTVYCKYIMHQLFL